MLVVRILKVRHANLDFILNSAGRQYRSPSRVKESVWEVASITTQASKRILDALKRAHFKIWDTCKNWLGIIKARAGYGLWHVFGKSRSCVMHCPEMTETPFAISTVSWIKVPMWIRFDSSFCRTIVHLGNGKESVHLVVESLDMTQSQRNKRPRN